MTLASDHAAEYLPLDLLKEKRDVTRRQVVQHGKRVYRSIYAGEHFDRFQFRWALRLAEQELQVAAHIPSGQIDDRTAYFRCLSKQPAGRRFEGECYGEIANAISSVKRHSPEFFQLPMKLTKQGEYQNEIDKGGIHADIANAKADIERAERLGSVNPTYLPELRLKLKLLESLRDEIELVAAE
jgi:hypothetical protein